MRTDVREYRQAREDFFARYGAMWPGTLYDPFDILELYPLPPSEIKALVEAVAALAAIYKRTAPLLGTLPDDVLLEMGMPPELLSVVRCTVPGIGHTAIGRFDLVRTNTGYRLLEFNTDAPGLLVETFSVNAKVCGEARRQDPNEGGEAILKETLLEAIRAGLEHVRKVKSGGTNVLFTSFGTFRRDRGVAEYLTRLVLDTDTVQAQYAPIEAVTFDGNGLCDSHGRAIEVLCRLIPLPFLHRSLSQQCDFASSPGTRMDTDSETLLFDVLRRRRIALINPPSAFLLASKVVQVVIWNLFEARMYFDCAERQLIEKYMLPTYMDPSAFREAYVVKPVFGEEGDSVSIMNRDGGPAVQAACTTYSDQPMVYQKYVEPPAIEVMTEYGPRLLHVVTSCFLLGGRPIGICMRAGGPITDDSAWVMPICVGDRP